MDGGHVDDPASLDNLVTEGLKNLDALNDGAQPLEAALGRGASVTESSPRSGKGERVLAEAAGLADDEAGS